MTDALILPFTLPAELRPAVAVLATLRDRAPAVGLAKPVRLKPGIDTPLDYRAITNILRSWAVHRTGCAPRRQRNVYSPAYRRAWRLHLLATYQAEPPEEHRYTRTSRQTT